MNGLEKQRRLKVSKLTQKEIESLKRAKGKEAEWKELVDNIKSNHGGQYPFDWYTEVIDGILSHKGITWRE